MDIESFSFPASFAQQRLWFLDQLDPGKSIYNIIDALAIETPVDHGILEQSLNEIVRRHESLRTTFTTVDGQPMQVIAKEVDFKLTTVDLRGFQKTERDLELQRLTDHEAGQAFDLAMGPLLRATLIRLQEQENILLVAVHHIVSDAWSVDVFLRELAVLYEAFSAGRPSPLPELPIQYADFAAWQRESIHTEDLQAQLSYWREHLSGAPTVLELATDRPRPVIQTFQGARKYAELPVDLVEHLRALSRREGVTLFMTLLAAFEILLWRYSGQEDLVVGVPMAGRTRSELEGIIGLFVNTLPLRADLSGNPSFREFLSGVREVALNAHSNQDIPFDKLVDELRPERSVSHTPLFQVLFSLENGQPLQSSSFSPKLVEVDRGISRSDLSLSIVDGGKNLNCMWEYSTDLFESDTIERMVLNFKAILESILEQPEERIAYLQIMTETERHRLLVERGSRETSPAINACVHHLFEAQAERTPDAVAVRFVDQGLTYRELNAKANQLAHYLQKRGVGPESLVGICTERSIEMVVGLLAILKAGGAYLPLDPGYPPERLAFMLHNSGAKVLLTEEGVLRDLPANVPPMVCLDRDRMSIELESVQNPHSGATGDNLAYVIYTSGSTGEPKGVQITHISLLNLVQWHHSFYQVTPSDRATLVAGVSFDASVWELWPYVLAGASVHIPDDETRVTPNLLRDWLLNNQITITFLPTPIAERVMLLSWPQQSTLRTVLTGGDRLGQYPSTALPFSLANNYGPTEATVVTTAVFLPTSDKNDDVPPIGYPILNAEVYVLDRKLQLVPSGVPGELYIGGRSLARGYLGDAALTAQKFVPHPFSGEPGSRLYRTGDIVRYRRDGQIEFVGRADHQVKIRGYRIEPREIESALTDHPAVAETVVVVHEPETGERRLIAYVVLAPELGATTEELRYYLREKLPDYMIPSSIMLLSSLPLTLNGKVDREALPLPETVETDPSAELVPPRTPIEKALKEIWSGVLGIDQVGINQNFFELGGDSILSIQIVARAKKIGVRLTPKQLFQYQTIAELAAVAETSVHDLADQRVVTGSVPLTPIQQWFFEKDLPDKHQFNQAMLLEVRSPLDLSLLERAASHLVLHHDALRMRFVREQMGWRQFISPPEDVSVITRVDLSKLAEPSRESAMRSAVAEVHASLNLSEGPLVRMAFFDFGPQQSGRLLIVIHHLVVDGVSWRILLEDLEDAYEQLIRRDAIELPPKTTSFQHWAERLKQFALSEMPRQEQDYWLALGDQQIGVLPMDYPTGKNQGSEMDSVSLSLNVDETEALLKQVPAAYRTQINDVLLTALAQAFAKWTGERSVYVDLEGHGREELIEGIDLTRTVGWFTTVFPAILNVDESLDPGSALQSIKTQLRGIPQRGIGYGLLRYLSEDKTSQERVKAIPTPQVSFNHLGQFDQIFSDSGLFRANWNLHSSASPRQSRDHLLGVDTMINVGRLQIRWTYSKEVHCRSTIEQLAHDFCQNLRSLIDHCQSHKAASYIPSDFPDAVLSQEQLDGLIAEIDLD